MRDEGFQKALDEVRAHAEWDDRQAEAEKAKARRAWEYCTVESKVALGKSWFDHNAFELVLVDSEPRRTFVSPDAALRELGEEGWECIQFHQDDGPRQQVIPMSLIQPPPWPVQYTLRFKREMRGDE